MGVLLLAAGVHRVESPTHREASSTAGRPAQQGVQYSRDPSQQGPITAGTHHSRDPSQQGPITAGTHHSRDPSQQGPITAGTHHNRDPSQQGPITAGTHHSRASSTAGTHHSRDPSQQRPITTGIHHSRDYGSGDELEGRLAFQHHLRLLKMIVLLLLLLEARSSQLTRCNREGRKVECRDTASHYEQTSPPPRPFADKPAV